MITEKIKSSNIRVPNNYVLIKMDRNNDTFQMKGKETGIMASPVVYEKGKTVSVQERLVSAFGTVVAAPEKIIFNGRKIKELSDRYRPIRETGYVNDGGERQKVIVDYSSFRKIKDLQKETLDYDTQIEVKKGDRVHVSYVFYLKAEREGLFIYDTDLGDLVLVRYDYLRMVVDEENQPKRMLNGLILIKPKKETTGIKEEEGVKILQRESGIVIVNPKETKRTRKTQKGTVLLCGTPVKGYMNEPGLVDDDSFYEEGDEILYDPRVAVKLENDLHQIISSEDLYIIRREAIIIDSNVFPNFDKIEIR